MKARAYAQSEQNEGGIFATFWTENESSVQAAASQRTIQEVCSIGFYGAASAAYAANYLYGTAPGDGDTSQCSVSISLAWDLWGSTDVLGQILTLDPDTENARSYEVCGIFSGNSDRVLYGAGSSDAFRYIELTHISLGNPSQSVQKFIAGSGLEQPDQLLCDAAVAWLLDALTGMPVILLLVGCLWNVLFRIFWNKKQRELMMFIVALLFVCLLPMWLSALPGWLIPNQGGQYGSVEFTRFGSRRALAGMVCSMAHSKGCASQSQRAASHSRHTWQHCICHHRLLGVGTSDHPCTSKCRCGPIARPVCPT